MIATPIYAKVSTRTEDDHGFAIQIVIVPAMTLPSDFDNAYAARFDFRIPPDQAHHYPPGKIYRLGMMED